MAKGLIRLLFINLVALWVVDRFFTGLTIEGDWSTLALGAFVLMIVEILVKPILTLLLLPINLLTLGTFRWVINALTLYIVTLIVPKIKVTAFLFPAISSPWLATPSFWLNPLLAYIMISLAISLITAFLNWVTS